MEKVYCEMLDVIRAEVEELYRLRRADAERLCRLERSSRHETTSRRRETGIAERRPESEDADVPRL